MLGVVAPAGTTGHPPLVESGLRGGGDCERFDCGLCIGHSGCHYVSDFNDTGALQSHTGGCDSDDGEFERMEGMLACGVVSAQNQPMSHALDDYVQ